MPRSKPSSRSTSSSKPRAEATSELTPDEVLAGQKQGWQLVEVWIPEKQRFMLEAHGYPDFAAPFASVPLVYKWLWNKAKQGDATCIKALKLISNYIPKKAHK